MKILRSTKGYSFVELLVAIGIIGILAGIAFTGLSGGNRAETTRSAALELRGAIRNAQEQALTSKLNSAGVPADHYGIKIVSSTRYQIIRIEKCGTLAGATVLSTVNLPSGVSLAASPTSLAAITFKKNKATPQFFDGSGNPVTPNGDGSVSLTLAGVGNYPIKVFQDTGRIE